MLPNRRRVFSASGSSRRFPHGCAGHVGPGSRPAGRSRRVACARRGARVVGVDRRAHSHRARGGGAGRGRVAGRASRRCRGRDRRSVPARSRTPWGTGDRELASLRKRAGLDDEVPDGVPEPYSLQLEGDHVGAAAAWDALGCPYEAALALADADEEEPLRQAPRGAATARRQARGRDRRAAPAGAGRSQRAPRPAAEHPPKRSPAHRA